MTVAPPQTAFSLTWVLGEADGQGRFLDLILKQVLLVEEQDDGGVGEPLVVADRIEQLQALLHSILRAHTPVLIRVRYLHAPREGKPPGIPLRHSEQELIIGEKHLKVN